MSEFTKFCNLCQTLKSIDDFNKRSDRPSGLQSKCKECAKAQNLAWRLANPERESQRNKEWRRNNPDKARAKELNRVRDPAKRKASHDNWRKNNLEIVRGYRAKRRTLKKANPSFYVRPSFMRKLYASECVYCSSRVSIEADHVIPISRGGCHSEGNLQPLCKSCNASKRDLLEIEWKIKMLTQNK